MSGLDETKRRANGTFPVRPAPGRTDQPKVPTQGSPVVSFGPWSEGTWFVVDVLEAVRIVCLPDKPADNATIASIGATPPQTFAGIHDWTMRKGCQWVAIWHVTQPTSSNEIAAWSADDDVALVSDDS